MHLKTGVFLLAAVFLSGPVIAGEDAELRQCRKLKREIDHYTELRRHGGSGKQMDAWKAARWEREKAFSDLRCSYYGSQL